jgi:hypothetical protein
MSVRRWIKRPYDGTFRKVIDGYQVASATAEKWVTATPSSDGSALPSL